ncbi:SRPBCC family protein [Flavobacteriaceae bacterium]|nr:SRPBCC family protein [Flavobacteriaceae bacterium]
MNLESPIVTTQKTNEELYNYLLDLNNFDSLMPENKEKFEVDGDSFIFGLKGMPEVRLVLEDKTPSSKIQFGSASTKLTFTLTVNVFKEISGANAQLNFDGKFSPMMGMMVKKPLTNFINTLAKNIGQL